MNIAAFVKKLGPRRRVAVTAFAALLVFGVTVSAHSAGVLGTSPAESATPAASASASPQATRVSGDSASNVVQVINRTDGFVKAHGNVQLNRISAPGAAPQNVASAYSSCTGCDTFAVALQINLVGPQVTQFAPGNAASAINYQCNGCRTYAIAYQYSIPVSDPTQVPPRVDQLMADMHAEMGRLDSESGATLQQKIDEVNAVMAQYQDLAYALKVQSQESTATTDPGATASPSPAGSPTPAPSSPSPASSPATTPEATPSPSPS